MTSYVSSALAWKGRAGFDIEPRLPSITDPVKVVPTPELKIAFAPTHGAVSYSIGITTYNPANTFYAQLGVPLTFTATVTLPLTFSESITEYYWDFGDGTEAWGNPATKTYVAAGPDTQAILRVTDTLGRKYYCRKQMYFN